MGLPKVWLWKTAEGYMVTEDERGGTYLAIFRSPAAAGVAAIEAKLLGHPEPLSIEGLWLSCAKIPAEGLAGYVWLDGDSVEFYCISDMPAAARELVGGLLR